MGLPSDLAFRNEVEAETFVKGGGMLPPEAGRQHQAVRSYSSCPTHVAALLWGIRFHPLPLASRQGVTLIGQVR